MAFLVCWLLAICLQAGSTRAQATTTGSAARRVPRGRSDAKSSGQSIVATVATCNTGFNADLKKNLKGKKGWNEVTGWRSNGEESELYNNRQQFDVKTGRFTATSDGYFLCSAQIRLDGGMFSSPKILTIRNQRDVIYLFKQDESLFAFVYSRIKI